MTEQKDPASTTPRSGRRRAFRPAGPAGTGVTAETPVVVEPPKPITVKLARPAGPPPRRPANRTRVAAVFIAAAAVAVLVSARVTVTDLDGNNQPSQPYRLRVIIHEDDNGHMTTYDLKYPDGGN